MSLICKDNLSKGLQFANAAAVSTFARYAIIIGEDEILKKQLTIKDLEEGSQKTIKIKEFIKHHLSK